MLKAKEAKDEIHASLAELLVPSGFRFRKSDQLFVRASQVDGERVQEWIGVPFYERPVGYEFCLIVCIRHEAVEELFHLFSGSSTPRYQAMSQTVAIPLEHFTPEASFHVNCTSDVVSATKQLAPVLRDEILPFTDRHRAIKQLDALVNGPVRADITLHPSGGMHAIILAHLADNPAFDELADKYQHEMQTGPNTGFIERYDLLLAHLRRSRAET